MSEDNGPTSGQLRQAEQAFQAVSSEGELPAIDFATFVLSLAHSARVHLGDAPNPADGETQVELTLARQTIDLLSMLEDKTSGNLSGDEERLLDQALYDLRMRFVEVAKKP